ncbi:MAG: IS3 family transposase [Thermomicrobiales bacterium]
MADLRTAAPRLSVRQGCALLGISRSWWYAHTAAADPTALALRDAIERVVLEHPGYGYRRVTHALRRDGWTINAKRVLRVMREESLLCQIKRRFVATTDARHGLGHYPNRLQHHIVTGPNQAWVADLTYIRLPTTFCYLAAILDAFSRRLVGWELSLRIDTDLTLAALEHALATRMPAPGLIHHSDHGVQYASHRYVARLAAIDAQISMAAIGNPYENAMAESFFATLKREEVSLHDYRTFAEAEANLERFLDEVYNHKRLHSSLGYCPPNEFEARWAAAHQTNDDDFLEDTATLPLLVVR